MIKSFKDKGTQDIFDGYNSKQAPRLPRNLYSLAREKLDLLEAAHVITDLKVPPGNRLEKLKGDMKNKYSIRINDQWRIIFIWSGGNAERVEIIDYH